MSQSQIERGIALGVLVFVYAIGALSRSTWYDESITLFTLANASTMTWPLGAILISEIQPLVETLASPVDVIQKLINQDVHPPFYFVLVNIWTFVFGNSLIAIRMFSVVASVLSVWVFYQWMLRDRPEIVRSATLVFAFSGLMIGVASVARSSALLVLLTTVAAYLSTQKDSIGEAETGIKREIALGVVFGAMLLTHYFAALIVIPMAAYRGFLFLSQRNWRYLLAPIVCFFLFLPWFTVFVAHLSARPDQGVGFEGLFAWAKVLIRQFGAIIIAPSNVEYPHALALLGQLIALALIGFSSLLALRTIIGRPSKWSTDAYAVFLVAIGISVLTLLFAVTDKMLSGLRYFSVFLPFLALLVASGANKIETFPLFKSGGRFGALPMSKLAVGVIIALQASMLNFGYENNAQVSGNYLNSVRADMAERPEARTLIVIDTAFGRGDILNAAVTFSGETEAFVLARSLQDWPSQLEGFKTAIAERQNVWMLYSISRGDMNSDKSLLYPEFVQALEAAGFERQSQLSTSRSRFHGLWRKIEH